MLGDTIGADGRTVVMVTWSRVAPNNAVERAYGERFQSQLEERCGPYRRSGRVGTLAHTVAGRFSSEGPTVALLGVEARPIDCIGPLP